MNRVNQYAVGAVFVASVAMVGWHFLFPPQATTLRQLLDKLSADATREMGDANTRFRAPLFPVEAIGTLINPNTNGPAVNDHGCLMSAEPALKAASNLFPTTYSTTARVAGDWDSSLKSFTGKVQLSADDKMDLRFSDIQIAVLSDDDVLALASSKACQEALANRQLWIVRGYVMARRQFETSRAVGNNGGMSSMIGNFKVDAGSGSGRMTISDEKPVPFLELVSVVSYNPQTKNLTVSPPTAEPAAAPEPAKAINKGHIFFQLGKDDSSGNDKTLINDLKAQGLPVVPTAQLMRADQLPTLASVRYFNDADLPAATTVLASVRKLYPTAQLQKLPLSAPAGQMEVWLPLAPASGSSAAVRNATILRRSPVDLGQIVIEPRRVPSAPKATAIPPRP